MPAGIVVANAILLTMDPSTPDPIRGWMSIGEDGRIDGLGEGVPPPGRTVVDVDGCFVAPGFVSAHSHLFTSGSRGLAADRPLYEWIEGMTRYTEHASAEDIYWCTLHGSLDFLNDGITTAYDFSSSRLSFRAASAGEGTYLGELRPQSFSDAQYRAKADSGIRFIHSVTLDEAAGTDEEVLSRVAHTVALDRGASGSAKSLGVAISGAVQWAESIRTARLEVEAMRRFSLINQPHLLETPFSIEAQQERFWWYEEVGALGPDLVFGHFLHTSSEIVKAAATAGCAMAWQPTSNARLGSGIADIPGYLAAGMRVGVGLDDQSCTDVSDPWQNMRMGIYLLRASRRDASLLGPRQMLALHTLGSAQALSIDHEVGSLAVGKYGDFLVVDPTKPDLGPVWDPYATYVLACGLRNLKQVWVGGELLSESGSSLQHDDGRVAREVHTRLGTIARRLER